MRLLGKAQEREMPFLEHLEELRRAILGAFAAILVCALGAYLISGQVVDFMVVQHVGEAQFLRPMEAFLARFKVSLLLGLLASLPFVMFQIWNFVVPGLLEQERKLVLPMVVFSTVLFLAGTAFSYLVLTPMMVKLLVGFATEHIRANISVEYLLDFIIRLALACGILFQLPLVVALLTIVRIVTPRFLWSKWRHAIVVILVLAAVATPGDGPSQIVLAAPIVVLYFLSILVSLLIVRGRDDESEEEGDSDSDPTPDPGSAGGGGSESEDREGSGTRAGTGVMSLGAGSAASGADAGANADVDAGTETGTVPDEGAGNAASGAGAGANADVDASAEAGTVPDPGAGTASDVESNVESDVESNVESDVESDVEPDAVADADPGTRPATDSDADSDSDSDSDSDADSDSESDSDADSDSDSDDDGSLPASFHDPRPPEGTEPQSAPRGPHRKSPEDGGTK